MIPMVLKSAGTTLLLNFLIPGAGHLYASGGEKWGLFAINITCAVTGTFLYVPWIGNLIVWVVSMSDSGKVTRLYNEKLDDQIASEENAETERARRDKEREAVREKAENERENARKKQARQAAASAKRQARIEKQRVSGAEIARLFARLHVLMTTGVMDENEVKSERGKFLAKASTGWTDEEMTDFLEPFAEIVQQGICKPEELQSVKALYSALKKGTPA